MSQSLVVLLSVITGIAVSSIYLIQPLLNTLSLDLNTSKTQVGLVMTLTQVGYGFGILLLVPLGDILPKKSLIIRKLFLLAAALAVTGFSKDLFMLILGSIAIGISATTAQDIVPLAADLSPESKRGQVIGTVMSGLLLGILLSRTVSGIISDAFGWRAVFWVFSGLTLLMLALFWLSIKDVRPVNNIHYGSLIRSTLTNFTLYPTLRKVILTQGLLGFTLSAFWTNLSFVLSAKPFEMSNSQIGLFGLAGAAGAFIAPLAGKFADKRGPSKGILLGASLVALSFAAMTAIPYSLIVLVVTTILFDLGVQMALISHQSVVYALAPESRSRFNALFVACLFVSFSLGSAISVSVLEFWGWQGVSLLCLAVSLLALSCAAVNRSTFERRPSV